MSSVRILLTGDYWHEDFRNLLQEMSTAITFQPIESLTALPEDGETAVMQGYELAIVAVTRPDQFSNATYQAIQDRFEGTPVIALLGSWCEGELRSGAPPIGIPRVYWHQWQSRYEAFESAVRARRTHEWMLPNATEAERITEDVQQIQPSESSRGLIAVSALTEQSFDMVADAAKCLGYDGQWTEYLEWQGKEVPLPDLLCVDGDSWSADIESRIRHLKEKFGELPCVLLLNYPRQEELESAKCLGVSRIVSKPFRLTDLQSAFDHCLSPT